MIKEQIKNYPLEDLCSDIIDCPHTTPAWKTEGVRVIRNFNIKDGHLDFSEGYFVDEETYIFRTRRAEPEYGDLVISREAPMGAVCIIPQGLKCCLGQRLVLLKIDKTIADPKFLNYTIQGNFVQTQISIINKTGSIVSNLNIPDLKSLIIPLPPLPIQRKIAAVLTALDDKIALNKRINDKLEAIAKRLYDYWFVQFEFPDENGRPYKSSGGKMVWNETLKREIPAGWEVVTFDDFLEIGNGKDHSHLADGPIPVYGSGGFMRGVTEFLYDGESVLFPRKGTLNNIMYRNEKFWTVDTMFYSKMRLPHSAIYMFYTAKQFDYEKLNTGTGVPSMTSVIIKQLPVIKPTCKLLTNFDSYVQSMYTRIIANRKQSSYLTALRDRLLPLLMNGQVEVGG